jgi:tetratricopeptide (TPR) repeat protein
VSARRRSLAAVVLPALAAAAVYAGTLDAGFVFDDRAQILGNPWVQELSNLPRALTSPVWAFKTPQPTNYLRPFQMGTYNLLWAAGRGSPLPFHLMNVVLHALVTATLAALVLRVSGERILAASAALLFAVHPLATEAVSWIACLPELGYALFGLVALLLHVRSARAAALASFGLALAAKETAVALPALVAVAELTLRPARGLRGAAVATAPYLGVALAYLVLRRIAVGGLAFAQGTYTLPETLLSAPSLLLRYLAALALPLRLSAFHVVEPVRSASSPRLALALAAVAALAAGAALLARRRPELGLAVGLTLVPLLPALTVPAVGVAALSERYAYLPCAGMAWLVAAALALCARRLAAPARSGGVALALAGTLALPAAVLTVARSRVWHDDERLARATLAVSPRAFTMWSLLASWHGRRGELEQALATWESAREIFPDRPDLELEIANTELLLRRIAPREAVERLERAMARDGESAEGLFYLGTALGRAGDHAAAERAFRRAIELGPSLTAARDGLAAALLAQDRTGEALSTLEAAADLPQGGMRGELLEGAAHLQAGRLDQAEAVFRRALEREPESAEALLALGLVASQRGDAAAAVELCRRAVTADPGLADGWQQLGVSALRAGDVRQAVEALERAAALDPHDPEVWSRLGVAYVRAGREQDARRAWTTALELDPGSENARHNLERLESGSAAP